MLRSVRVSLALVLSLSCVCKGKTENPVFHDPSKPFTAKAEVLALRSSVLTGSAGGQQTFLAHVRVKGEERLVILVDRYRSADVPIRPSVLASHRPLSMRLQWDENCDAPARYMVPSLRGSILYDPSLIAALDMEASASLPCYQVDHQHTRLWSR